jgi:peptidoglycan/xylan/chitin deacetylase (PgdA/CDA1 family)
MSTAALILAYHAVEPGPAPLCIEPDRFRAHLNCLADAGARTLTIGELATALARGALPDRAVAITFDDGAASVAEIAAPMLAERAMRATVFCVAGHLGHTNDWPTDPPGTPRFELADAAVLRDLADAGLEIGSHGMEHTPLSGAGDDVLRREVVESRQVLEAAVGRPVLSFAYPYGLVSPRARALAESTYSAACAGGNARAALGADVFALPRVETHYLRDTRRLRRALDGSDLYLRVRRIGGRARRIVDTDHAPAG